MILDTACGSRMFWFDKKKDGVVFGDIRKETQVLSDGRVLQILPDVQLDFTALPFPSNTFEMVVFDPPHLLKVGDTSWLAKKYGKLFADWRNVLQGGFDECFRVLMPNHFLIFKWNSTDISVSSITEHAPHTPLFGHKSGKNSKTHWLCFRKES